MQTPRRPDEQGVEMLHGKEQQRRASAGFQP
jgi:hypothetical protein